MLKRTTIVLAIIAALLAGCSEPTARYTDAQTQVFPDLTAPAVPTALPPTPARDYPAPATPEPRPPYPGETVVPTFDSTRAAVLQVTAIAADTATTAALLQTATAEEAPGPTSAAVATSSPPVAPTITTITSRPNCIPGSLYTHCHDEVLAIDFDYPSSWGAINARYVNGGYSGYAYEYDFSANNISDHQAGGRSRDYSEGRGGVVTDFRGYTAKSAAFGGLCEAYNALLCRDVRPSVSVVLPVQWSSGMFPSTAYYCDRAQQIVYSPAGMVAINLPGNHKINGFVFVSRILSEATWAELAGLLGVSDANQAVDCQSPTVRQQYDSRVQSLLADLQAGTAERATQSRFNQLLHLAQSIRID